MGVGPWVFAVSALVYSRIIRFFQSGKRLNFTFLPNPGGLVSLYGTDEQAKKEELFLLFIISLTLK